VVDPVYMFSLAAQHARWATVRQAVITGNIANANTPGYDAQDIQPFSAVLDDTPGLTMAETMPGHINVGGDDSGDNAPSEWDVASSGAPVALDREMMKADETNRAFALDTSVVRAFHRMLLASVRSGS
jgi:flagellar basal-body rod protein FlgB